MHCNCCYDHLLDLIIERLKQMESAHHIVMGRDRDVKNMRTVRLLLERKCNENYDWENGMGVWKAKPRQGMPWDKEGYVSPIDHIPRKVINRHCQREMNDFRYALDLMKRHLLHWWQ